MLVRPWTIGVWLLALAAAGAQAEIAEVVGPRTLAALRSRGKLTRTALGGGDLRYMPAVACDEAIRAGVDGSGATVVVELAALAVMPGRELDGPTERLRIYNTLRSVSRLEGLHYYSVSRGALRLLYKVSHQIASPSSRLGLADSLVTAPPPHDEIWVYQDDTTFGGNVFAVSYDEAPEYLLMRVANHDTMRYLFFPVVQPGEMLLYFLIVPDREEVLFYSVAAARLLGPWARAGAVAESFSNRVDAMYRWFTQMLQSP